MCMSIVVLILGDSRCTSIEIFYAYAIIADAIEVSCSTWSPRCDVRYSIRGRCFAEIKRNCTKKSAAIRIAHIEIDVRYHQSGDCP